MPATTSRGYPYPVGSDAVNIVGDIQGLAEAVDTDVTSSLAGKLSTTGGGTVTGNISASTAPTLGAHLTNKTYVDTQDQKYLPLVGGQISSTLWVDGGMRLGGNGAQLIIVDTAVDSVLHSYIAFYGQGTSVASPGTRLGYVGFPGQNHLYIQNEVAGGAISVNSATDGVDIGAHNNRPVNVYNEGVVTASFHPTALLVGKTTGDMGSGAGTELWSRGPNNGSILSTIWNTGWNLVLGHNGAADAHGSYWTLFQRSNVPVGSISQNGSSGVNYNISSDYRLKTVVGPISDAVERFMDLRPYRVTWNEDPERGEIDAFLAHEVDEVVPDAVTGTKDAVAGPPPMVENPYDPDGPQIPDPTAPSEGTILAQQLDMSRLIPLVVGALQELVGRVEALEAV